MVNDICRSILWIKYDPRNNPLWGFSEPDEPTLNHVGVCDAQSTTISRLDSLVQQVIARLFPCSARKNRPKAAPKIVVRERSRVVQRVSHRIHRAARAIIVRRHLVVGVCGANHVPETVVCIPVCEAHAVVAHRDVHPVVHIGNPGAVRINFLNLAPERVPDVLDC